MKSTAKAQAQARELKEKLELRFKGSATIDQVRQINDAQGWPMLICSDAGAEAAGDAVIAIRIKAADAVSKDVFGNDLVAFTPHTIELAYEEGVPAHVDIIKTMAEVQKIGMKLAVKEITSGQAVTESNVDAADVTASLEFEVQWPTRGL